MSDRMLAADVNIAALEVDALDPADVVQGDPAVSSAELADLDGSAIGIWQITAGQVTDIEADEVFIVLSGRGHVEFEDGSVLDLQPGTAARLRAGERTTWTITETLRKIYVLSAAAGAERMDNA